MLKTLDIAAKSLLIVGGVNWLSAGVGGLDLVARATGSSPASAGRSRPNRVERALRRGKHHPNAAATTLYGVVGAAAVYSLGRAIAKAVLEGRRPAGAVREAMTSQPQSVTPATSVREAADVGSLPVVENGRLLGILTDRDIALRVVAEGRDPATVTAGQIASRELVTVEPKESLHEALRLMAHRQVRRLPVVEDGRLVGMLAQADVARRGTDAATGDVVEQISR
jgi:CBS domain-containing protein